MLDEISYKFQGLSSSDYNFQGLSRPLIFILKFKDFQGACEPWDEEQGRPVVWLENRWLTEMG